MQRWILLTFVMLMCGIAASVLGAERSRPTPRLYVTHNHGVRLEVRRGFEYCRLPEGWVGTDHGTRLFLARVSCEDEGAPAVSIYYGFNQSEIERADGEATPPRTDVELRSRGCEGRPIAIAGLSLLGRMAALCLERRGGRVTMTAFAVYALVDRTDGLDHELRVTLNTTRPRLVGDLGMFRLVLAGLSICTPEWARGRHEHPVCAAHTYWW